MGMQAEPLLLAYVEVLVRQSLNESARLAWQVLKQEDEAEVIEK